MNTEGSSSVVGMSMRISVPLGPLGIVIGRPSSASLLPQAVYIFSVSPSSPLGGRVEPGDVIESVGMESCEGLGGRGVTKMLRYEVTRSEECDISVQNLVSTSERFRYSFLTPTIVLVATLVAGRGKRAQPLELGGSRTAVLLLVRLGVSASMDVSIK